jgi:NAD-specific glutamate dehydrogenase
MRVSSSACGTRSLLHLLQNEGGDLRGRICLAFDLDPGVAIGGACDLVGDELLVLLHHWAVIATAHRSAWRPPGPRAGQPGDVPNFIYFRPAWSRAVRPPTAFKRRRLSRRKGAHPAFPGRSAAPCHYRRRIPWRLPTCPLSRAPFPMSVPRSRLCGAS